MISLDQRYDEAADVALETTFFIVMTIYGLVTAIYFFGNLKLSRTENPKMIELLRRLDRLERIMERMDRVEVHLRDGGKDGGDDLDGNDDDNDYVDAVNTFGNEHIHCSPPQRPPSPPASE